MAVWLAAELLVIGPQGSPEGARGIRGPRGLIARQLDGTLTLTVDQIIDERNRISVQEWEGVALLQEALAVIPGGHVELIQRIRKHIGLDT